jgi:hypothetical protein
MAYLDRPFRSVGELHDDELECFSKMPCRELGVLAALDYCARNQIPLPQSTALAAAPIVAKILRGQQTKNIGRSGGIVSGYRQTMIHFVRHDIVCEIREQQIILAETVAELQTYPNIPTKILKERQRLLDWTGRSLERAYECAAIMLKGTIASGKPATIQRSYFEYRRICKDPSQVMRFHLLHSSIIQLLGIKGNLVPRQVREVVP